jgi:biotin operon repressor
MNPSSYFFRVEHDLLRSEAFKTLGGSAIKVYLVIGLYSDFGTDWAYPSIRTIARQGGLSRQTVLNAIEQLSELGLLVTNKAKGRSTAYRIIRQAPQRPTRRVTQATSSPQILTGTGLDFLEEVAETGPKSLDGGPFGVLETRPPAAQTTGRAGPRGGPNREPIPIEGTTSVPIPGTPFRLTAEGRLHVAVDLQELLTNHGIPTQLAQRLLDQKDPEAVAKVLLNALYLQSQGKLQNGAGYIRAGIEDGYDLLPQVASRLEIRRRELEDQLRKIEIQQRQMTEGRQQADEQAAISFVLNQLAPDVLKLLVEQALHLLPEPIVRRNPTLSNPFVRGKVYELACGEPEVGDNL